ncbi:TonB-dependent receptor [Parapedobacter sp. ISTM3]|uniref:TonB-dependent receptor n=1 Tax=Parapedobacter luteus TaxID=623280 RepID=A0A1T5AHL1_9SPHI|nr:MULTISPECIES: TonB-dependent receptor [Parapedobacter]MBK1441795.1 TonB-dependent receptor [Parapedobacter sp. ISTM3]SKB34492.1 TonB-dependent receptor [Parapedobacter luteus]
MLKRILFLLFGNVCLSSMLFAQQGRIVGTVSESGTTENLSGVSVAVKGSTIGVATDFEGDYSLELAPGIYTIVYSFIGYETKEVESVEVKAGDVVHLDVAMVVSADMLGEVVVTTTARQNTEISLLNMQRNASTLMDGLSLQSINRSGASSIASAVRVVPGVSIQDGKFVYVRGLGDRYTKSILNGMDIPGLDPDKNTVQMDIFPTNILENIVVVKSASAELPADFTGGVVDVVTKDFPTQRQFNISISGGFNPDMHFKNNYLSYAGGGTDFLGFDDGTRKLPISSSMTIPSPAGDNGTLEGITRSFNPIMAADRQNSFADFSIGANYGNQYNIGVNKLGVIASIEYKNTTTFYEGFRNGVYQKPENNSELELRSDRTRWGDLGVRGVLGSVLAGISYKTERSKYVLNLLHIQNGESRAALFDQRTEISNVINVVKNNLEYTQRSVSNLQLGGKHTNSDASFTTEWKLSPTLAKVYDKDVRLTTFIVGSNGYTIGSDAGFPNRVWRDLDEMNLVGKLDFTKKYQLFAQGASLKFGGLYSYKQRDYSIQSYNIAYRAVSTGDLNGDPNAILADENVWTPETNSGYFVRGNFQPANTFDATQLTAAIYVSNEAKIGDRLRTVIGLRAEQFTSLLTGQNSTGTINYDNEKTIEKLDLFPSANLIYALTAQSNVRVAYSRTTARPTFKEISPVQIADLLTDLTFLGNLDLKPTYINNIDVRYELFGDNAQLFALSGFYKRFKDPIELVAYSNIAPTNVTPRNAPEADVFGVELEGRKNLGFISDGLEKLSVNVNVSFIESRIAMSKGLGMEYDSRLMFAREGEVIDDTRQLQGQSPYLINAGLNYNNSDIGLETGLFYNVQGKTLEVVGLAQNPDVYVQPFHSLNFNFSKKLGSQRGTISVKVENILDDNRESLYESYGAAKQAFQFRNPGRNFSLGYSWSF